MGNTKNLEDTGVPGGGREDWGRDRIQFTKDGLWLGTTRCQSRMR